MGIQARNESRDAEIHVCARRSGEEVDESRVLQHEAEQGRCDHKVSHTRSTQERLCDDGIETRLKQNREVTEQRESETKRKRVRRSQSAEMKEKRRHQQERGAGSHVTDSDCRSLRPGNIGQRRCIPGRGAFLSPWSFVRLVHLSLTRTFHHRPRGLCTVVEGRHQLHGNLRFCGGCAGCGDCGGCLGRCLMCVYVRSTCVQ